MTKKSSELDELDHEHSDEAFAGFEQGDYRRRITGESLAVVHLEQGQRNVRSSGKMM
jgi:hypothetical protein